MQRWIVALSLVVLSVGCSEADRAAVAAEDEAMQAASQRALDTLDSFIERVTGPDPPSSRSLLARVGSAAGVERAVSRISEEYIEDFEDFNLSLTSSY